jgi:uncharacterized protein (DUF952 family)
VSLIYKILNRPEWEAALAQGVYLGSALDRADGFIHLSTAAQAHETARRYFAGQTDLVLLAIDDGDVAPALKWEPSRGGDLFPHIYGPLATGLVKSVRDIALDAEGVPMLGELA